LGQGQFGANITKNYANINNILYCIYTEAPYCHFSETYEFARGQPLIPRTFQPSNKGGSSNSEQLEWAMQRKGEKGR